MTPAARARSRRGEGDQLRAEILAAAEDLLMRTASEDAVSIRAVADAVGVTPPSIYRHFEDKTMLLLEVCRHSFVQFNGALESAVGDGAPERQIETLARAYIRYAIDYPEHYRIMFMSRFELTAQAYAEEMMADDSSFGLLLRITTELIEAGKVRPDLADKGPLHVGILFWSMVHGLASLFVAKPGLPWPDRDQLVDDLIASISRGIGP
jgi:AcrR family transcriptional regulator